MMVLLVVTNVQTFAANITNGEAVKGAYQLIFSNPILAKSKLDSILKILPNHESDSVRAKLFNSFGVYYAVTGNNDSALWHFDKVIELFKNVPEEVAGTKVNQSIVYKAAKNYSKSLALLNEALGIYQKINNLEGVAYVYSEKSSNYNQLTKYDLAVQYAIKSIEFYEKNKEKNASNIAVGKQKLGNLYLMLKDYEFATKLYAQVLPYFKQTNDNYKTAITLLNEADAFYNLKKYLDAKNDIELALNLLKPFNNFDIISLAYKHKANIYNKLTKTALAYNYFDSALIISNKGAGKYYKEIFIDKVNFLVEQKQFEKAAEMIEISEKNNYAANFDLNNKILYCELKVIIYKGLNKANLCLDAYQQLSYLKDSLFEYNKNELALKLQAKYKANILQKEVEIMNFNNKLLLQQNEISKRTLIIGIVVFLLLLIFTIFKIQVHKLQGNVKQLELTRLEQEKEFLANEKSILAENIKLKEDIISQQKSELLGMIQQEAAWNEKVNALMEKLTIAEQIPLKHRFQELIATNKSWDIFINKFQHINPNFIHHLSLKYPALSKGDLEFCALVKMNLSYKEIANLLAISHKSVIIKKYRIVKKINLQSDEDFFNLILSID